MESVVSQHTQHDNRSLDQPIVRGPNLQITDVESQNMAAATLSMHLFFLGGALVFIAAVVLGMFT
jgi:hypothetical protein